VLLGLAPIESELVSDKEIEGERLRETEILLVSEILGETDIVEEGLGVTATP
jgi:hypothetical protein